MTGLEFRVRWITRGGRHRQRIFQTADRAEFLAARLAEGDARQVQVDVRQVDDWQDGTLGWFLAVATYPDGHQVAAVIRAASRARSAALMADRHPSATVYAYALGYRAPRARTEKVYGLDWRLPTVDGVTVQHAASPPPNPEKGL